jgi:hypothetical protein
MLLRSPSLAPANLLAPLLHPTTHKMIPFDALLNEELQFQIVTELIEFIALLESTFEAFVA